MSNSNGRFIQLQLCGDWTRKNYRPPPDRQHQYGRLIRVCGNGEASAARCAPTDRLMDNRPEQEKCASINNKKNRPLDSVGDALETKVVLDTS